MGFPKLVTCVDNGGGYDEHLIVGKQYTVVKEDEHWVYLEEDELGNKIAGYEASRFQDIVSTTVTTVEEYTGSSVSYYAAEVVHPTNPEAEPYTAECNDIIEALGMTFAEGNVFKALWRSCAARKLGKAKKGYDNGLYDAEKIVFFGNRMVTLAKAAKPEKKSENS